MRAHAFLALKGLNKAKKMVNFELLLSATLARWQDLDSFEQLKRLKFLDELIRLRQFRTSNECASNYRPFLYAFYFKFCRPTDSPITARKCTFHSMAKY